MSHQARLSRNYLALAAARFGAKVISFVAWVLIARRLGAADFGLFTFSFAAITLAVVVFQAGLTALVVREIARDRAQAPKLLSISLLVRGAGSAAVIAAAAAIYALFPGKGAAATAVTAVVLSLSTLLGSFTDVMQAFERMEYYAAVIIINNLLLLGAVVYALSARAGLLDLLWLYGAANGLTLLIAATICAVRFAKPTPALTWRDIKGFLKCAPDFQLSALVASIYWRADKVILKAFAGDRVVGIYGAAAGMVEGLVWVAGAFRESIFPSLSRYWPADPARFRETSHTAFKFLVALAFPIGVGTTVIASKLFPLIYGGDYSGGWIVLAILIWALAAIFVRELTAATLFALDRQRALLISNAVGAAASVGINVALIPWLGAVGAALAGVATAFATTILNLVLIAHKVPRLYQWTLALKPAAAAAGMAAAVVAVAHFLPGIFAGWHFPGFLKPAWLVVLAAVAGGGLVYIAGLFALGYYRPAQIKQLLRTT